MIYLTESTFFILQSKKSTVIEYFTIAVDLIILNYISYEKSITFRRFAIPRNVGCQISRMWDVYRIIYR